MSKHTYIVRNTAGRVIATRTTAREYRFSDGESFSINQKAGFKYPVELVTTSAQKAEVKEYKRQCDENASKWHAQQIKVHLNDCVRKFHEGKIDFWLGRFYGAEAHAHRAIVNAREAIKFAKKAKIEADEKALFFASFERAEVFTYLGLVQEEAQDEAQDEVFVTEPEAEVKAMLEAVDAPAQSYRDCANAYNNYLTFKRIEKKQWAHGYNFICDALLGKGLDEYHPIIKPVMRYVMDNCEANFGIIYCINFLSQVFKIALSLDECRNQVWVADRIATAEASGIPARVVWLLVDLRKFISSRQ